MDDQRPGGLFAPEQEQRADLWRRWWRRWLIWQGLLLTVMVVTAVMTVGPGVLVAPLIVAGAALAALVWDDWC